MVEIEAEIKVEEKQILSLNLYLFNNLNFELGHFSIFLLPFDRAGRF